MRRFPVLSFAAAAAAAILLLLWFSSDEGAPDPDHPGPPAVSFDDRTDGGDADAAAQDGSSLVTGLVTRNGTPVAARVEVRAAASRYALASPTLARAPAIRSRNTDASGAFRLTGLATGTWEIEARAPDGCFAAVRARIGVPGEHVDVRIDLPTGGTALSGRVIHRDDSPFHGLVAAVAVFRLQRWWHGVDPVGGRPVATDRNGRFTIRGLGSGDYRLWLSGTDRFSLGGRAVVIPSENEVVVVVEEGLETLTGRVVSARDGKGVAGATITSRWGWRDAEFTGAESDATGVFEILIPGDYVRGGNTFELATEAEGYATFLAELRPDTREARIPLEPAAGIHGRVLDGKGRPVAGSTVTLWPRGVEERDAKTVRTGPDGSYAIPNLASGEYVLFARGGGFVSAGLATAARDGPNPLAVRIATGEDQEHDLVVVRAAALSGIVRDAEGEPVPGATVNCAAESDHHVDPDDRSPWRTRRTAADPDGRYRLDDLLPGFEYRLAARAPGQAPVTVGPIKAPAGGTAEVDLRFEPSYFVVVRAIEKETGAPIPGVLLTISLPGAWRGGGGGETSADGVARLGPYADAQLAIQQSHPEFLGTPPLRLDRNDAPEREVTIELERGLAIEGRLVFPDGKPVTSGKVVTRSHAGRGHVTLMHAVGPTGTFRISPLAPENYRLQAMSVLRDGVSWWMNEAVAAGTSGHVFTLKPTPDEQRFPAQPVTIRLNGPDGKPVSTATVWFSQHVSVTVPGGVWKSTIQVYPGQEGAPFIVFGARSADGRELGSVVAGPVAPGEMTVQVPEAQAISGTLTGEGRRPVPGVLVLAYPVYDGSQRLRRKDQSPVARAHTDSAGRYRLAGLGAGNYRVVYRTTREFRAPDEITAAAGTDGHDFRLARNLRVKVTVLDAENEPLPGARVIAYPSGPRSRESVVAGTGPDGSVSLGGILPGIEYSLYVNAPPNRLDLSPPQIRVRSWTPKDETFRFEGGAVICGIVLDLSGRPLAGATVQKQAANGAWVGAAYAGTDGRFAAPVAMGTRVRLRAFTREKAVSEPVEAEGGTEGITLRVERRVNLRVEITNWRKEFRGQAGLTAIHGPGGCEWIAGDGVAVLENLSPTAKAALFVGVHDSDLIAYVPDCDVGKGSVTVTLAPGETITGRLHLPEKAATNVVRVWGPAFMLRGVAIANGTFEIRGVPSGTWSLRADWKGEDREKDYGHASTTATTGTFVEVEFPKE